MRDSGSENECELIIDPVLLSQIQAHCRKIAAELEAQADTERYSAEYFAAAVPEMPANVRRFFEAEDQEVRPLTFESVADREQRQLWESIGGWCG